MLYLAAPAREAAERCSVHRLPCPETGTAGPSRKAKSGMVILLVYAVALVVAVAVSGIAERSVLSTAVLFLIVLYFTLRFNTV